MCQKLYRGSSINDQDEIVHLTKEFNLSDLMLDSEFYKISENSELCCSTNSISNTTQEDQEIIKNLVDCSNNSSSSSSSSSNSINSDDDAECYKGDFIAAGTQHTRTIFKSVDNAVDKLKSTIAYKILSKTTQPAHIIAVIVVSLVAYFLWPAIVGNDVKTVKKDRSILLLLLYLGSFATHFGAQIWMTFVSGLALYFSLPRHTFGQCQRVLFPTYYALGSALSMCTLISFANSIDVNLEKSSTRIQISILSLCLIVELIIRLYLTPLLLGLMKSKNTFEVKAGTGQEIGHLAQGGLVKCTRYQRIHKSFRRVHMVIGIGNIISLVCTCIHLEYLASKIQFQL